MFVGLAVLVCFPLTFLLLAYLACTEPLKRKDKAAYVLSRRATKVRRCAVRFDRTLVRITCAPFLARPSLDPWPGCSEGPHGQALAVQMTRPALSCSVLAAGAGAAAAAAGHGGPARQVETAGPQPRQLLCLPLGPALRGLPG